MNDQLRDLLKGFLTESDADDVLAARTPWLCPDCKGTGRVDRLWMNQMREFVCDHDAAPTLADMVALWEAVHGGISNATGGSDAWSRGWQRGCIDMLDVLRDVRAVAA